MKPFIYYIRHCMRYEAGPDRTGTCTRERWTALKKSDPNAYFKRITPARYFKENARIDREAVKLAYDKAIMEKYNVGPDYRQNRWFMEQVRPTI